MLTVEAVARENGTVIDMLPVDGIAVFPGDDASSDLWAELAGTRTVLRFGFSPDFDVYADQIHPAPTHTVCCLHKPLCSTTLAFASPGLLHFTNPLSSPPCSF